MGCCNWKGGNVSDFLSGFVSDFLSGFVGGVRMLVQIGRSNGRLLICLDCSEDLSVILVQIDGAKMKTLAIS